MQWSQLRTAISQALSLVMATVESLGNIGTCFDWILLRITWTDGLICSIVSRCKEVYYTCFFICHKGLFFSSARGHLVSFMMRGVYGPKDSQALTNDRIMKPCVVCRLDSQWVLIHIFVFSGSNWDWLDCGLLHRIGNPDGELQQRLRFDGKLWRLVSMLQQL